MKTKIILFILLILFFLGFSFYPTFFELRLADKLYDPAREFILEHNFYWPDYNLYLSKIRQGFEGKWLAQEKYTSENHKGSLIQGFYLYLGKLGGLLDLNPNYSYLLGRIILSPLLLSVVALLCLYYFKNTVWQIIAFITVLVSGSFPRIYFSDQTMQIGRFMEWWSNIDAVQRTTFIPHIVFGQVVSFFLLYKLTIKQSNNLTMKQLIIYIILANLTGLVFPPSLITLISVILLILFIRIIFDYKKSNSPIHDKAVAPQDINFRRSHFELGNPGSGNRFPVYFLQRLLIRKSVANCGARKFISASTLIIFIIFSLPSLLYILILTKQMPWSSLVEFHRTHPMMIPFWDYILGTGPVFFLGFIGCVVSVLKRDRKFHPLIFWILSTFIFAIIFTHIKEQSPLRFTQTGLFIPLGILSAYLFKFLWDLTNKILSITNKQTSQMLSAQTGNNEPIANNQFPITQLSDSSFTDNRQPTTDLSTEALAKVDNQNTIQVEVHHIAKTAVAIIIFSYIALSLYMMTISLKWQTTFITQRVRAFVPPVPFPPQTMYPLREWMQGIRWLRDNTNHESVVLAQITAGNHIPAYSGNTVYFGQSNTVNYEKKQLEVIKFFEGKMDKNEALIFLKNGNIKYVFFSVQEKELAKGRGIREFYPYLEEVYQNPTVSIYTYRQ